MGGRGGGDGRGGGRGGTRATEAEGDGKTDGAGEGKGGREGVAEGKAGGVSVTIGEGVGVGNGNGSGSRISPGEPSNDGPGDGGKYVGPGDQSRSRGERPISGSKFGAIGAASLRLIRAEAERDWAWAITFHLGRKRRPIAKTSSQGRGEFTSHPKQTPPAGGKKFLKLFLTPAFFSRARFRTRDPLALPLRARCDPPCDPQCPW